MQVRRLEPSAIEKRFLTIFGFPAFSGNRRCCLCFAYLALFGFASTYAEVDPPTSSTCKCLTCPRQRAIIASSMGAVCDHHFSGQSFPCRAVKGCVVWPQWPALRVSLVYAAGVWVEPLLIVVVVLVVVVVVVVVLVSVVVVVTPAPPSTEPSRQLQCHKFQPRDPLRAVNRPQTNP